MVVLNGIVYAEWSCSDVVFKYSVRYLGTSFTFGRESGLFRVHAIIMDPTMSQVDSQSMFCQKAGDPAR